MNPSVLAVAIPFIIGIVSALKEAGLPSKLAPLLCLVVGVGIVVLLSSGQFNVEILLVGLLTGLAATGSHSGISATATGIKEYIAKK